ncbi:hypothetical protein ACK11Z_10950 [Methanoculleus bourgensis]|uniref:hypothetical protein n=1 Tax=Methanoculleus bourgensis TaxID=83986 RepID=UPI003B959E91
MEYSMPWYNITRPTGARPVVPAVGVGREGRPDEGGKFPDPGIAVMEVLRETIRGPKTWGPGRRSGRV